MDTTEDSDCLPGDRPLRALSDSALQIARLERHLQETPQDSSDTLRKSLQLHLDAAKQETRLREPEGHLLNRALSKQKLAGTALQTAQDRFSQCQRDLQAAQESLAQARLNEEQATLEVTKLRASIAEQERPPLQPQLPSQVLIPLFAQLQQAGLSLVQMSCWVRPRHPHLLLCQGLLLLPSLLRLLRVLQAPPWYHNCWRLVLPRCTAEAVLLSPSVPGEASDTGGHAGGRASNPEMLPQQAQSLLALDLGYRSDSTLP